VCVIEPEVGTRWCIGPERRPHDPLQLSVQRDARIELGILVRGIGSGKIEVLERVAGATLALWSTPSRRSSRSKAKEVFCTATD
jgi:hypothetical protein